MDMEKLIVRFRNEVKELNELAITQLAPQSRDFFKTVGKLELLELFIEEINSGEWDEEE